MIFLDVDPSVVKPGWTPLIITILLAGAIVLLMISMRRQIRKINAPRLEDLDRERAEQDSTPAGDAQDHDAQDHDAQDQDESAETTSATSATRPSE